MRKSLSLLCFIAFSASAIGAPERMIGSWHVTIEKDPFSTKKKTVAGLPASNGAGVLAIRCFPEGGLSTIVILVRAKQFDPGSAVAFKYRADEGTVVNDSGQAFGEGAIEMPNARQILQDAQSATSIYLRMETADKSDTDLEFRPRGSAKALQQIIQDCPAGAAPGDDKEEKKG